MLLLLHYRGRTWVAPLKDNQPFYTFTKDPAFCTFTLVPWWHTLQWNNIIGYTLNGTVLNWPKREVSSEFHAIFEGEEQSALQICLPSLLPSKWLYHIIISISLCTCQLTTVQEHVHHLKLCSGRLETNIKPTPLHIKHILWLPATERQDTPWTETSIFM